MEGWKKMAFADVATKFFSGGTPSTKDSSLWDGDIQWITSKWLNERLYLSYGEKNISEKGLRSSATKLVKARSLILATRVGVGKVSINEIDLAINQDLLGIEIDEYNYSLEFLAYQLRSQKSQDYISSFKRGATIQGVTQDCIKSIELNIPPLPEQHKIAHVLGKVQKAIEQQDKLIRTTTELKKAFMQKLFTEGTRGESQKETEIGLVPESWEVVKMEECLLQTQYGLSAKGNEKGNVPILRMTNQKDGYISNENLQYVNILEKELVKFKVNIDDVIFNRTNSFELVGRTAIFKLSGDYIFASYLIRLITNSKKLYPEFLNFYLNADETQNRLKSIATRGVSQSNISATRLRGFVIPLPSLAEQIEIISTIKTFNQKIEFQNKKKQTLTALFKTLLHELMTGQRRVHELEFEEEITGVLI